METLNESTSAEQRFFLSVQFQKRKIQTVFLCFRNIRRVKKSLAVSTRGFHRNFPNSRELTDLRQLHFYTGNS